ncbi:hypothetical protein FHS39_002539 [Streptomyces olivoverticillatus]|uniref:Uncharacterized protein n=1 Tax=Streptomyces olivoverticillatus TaxID=66427 RepID=A0A7W7PLK4_9ACTN|nr:hypothetical protein [Streptomyces olivoverticillatus]MBB4893508.1 hypothetical protein [Streptomyces olivoverticillatus]
MDETSDLDDFQGLPAASAARSTSAAATVAAANPLLMAALGAAVPLHMMKLRRLSSPQCAAIARQCVETIGFQGDALQYGGKGCAEAFNALARGLAALALTADGGVTFAGTHWCRRTGCRDLHGDHPTRYTDHPLPDLPREEAA